MHQHGLVLLLWITLVIACATPPTARPVPGYGDDRLDSQGDRALAQGCSPGMSCFGHVVVLPDGEVAEAAATAAAATAAATATATAAVQGAKDAKSKDKGKSAEKEKADAKTQVKRQVPCELRGAGEPTPKSSRIRCTYYCPGDPPGYTRDVVLDAPCPQTWSFWL